MMMLGFEFNIFGWRVFGFSIMLNCLVSGVYIVGFFLIWILVSDFKFKRMLLLGFKLYDILVKFM